MIGDAAEAPVVAVVLRRRKTPNNTGNISPEKSILSDKDGEQILMSLPVLRYCAQQSLLKKVADQIELYRIFRTGKAEAIGLAQLKRELERCRRKGRISKKAWLRLHRDTHYAIADAAIVRDAYRTNDPSRPLSLVDTKLHGLGRVLAAIEDGKDLTELYSAALRALPEKSRPGADSGNLDWLVGQLGLIYERWTGLPFNRTRNGKKRPSDFVAAVLRIAEPTRGVTPDQIDERIRAGRKKLRSWKPIEIN